MTEHELDAQETRALAAAVRAGDERAFTALCSLYRKQLRVHCYRMLGSFDEAEDMVQETLLRAWRGRDGFEGRSLVRTWLYRIATNVCLNALERTPRRVLPHDVAPAVTAATPASEARSSPSWAPELPWLQPFPDSSLELAAPEASRPDAAIVSRETIELAYLAALQHLPPRQRATLILADVLGWSAKEIAELLEVTVATVTSALQRAHLSMREHLPADRDQPLAASLSEAERTALASFMQAWEGGDASVLTALLREDARWTMPPAPLWFDGRASIERMLQLYPPRWRGRELKMLPVGANRQPAAAAYLRLQGEREYRFSGVHLLRVVNGQLVEITTFSPELCRGFGLPATL